MIEKKEPERSIEVEVRPVGKVLVRRRSNAQFRKIMNDKKAPKRERMRAYSVLRYRKQFTHGR